MKLLVVHDHNGDIHLMAAIGSRVSGKVGFKAQHGHEVSQIDMADLPAAEKMDRKTYEHLRHIQRNFRVERTADTARLLPKAQS